MIVEREPCSCEACVAAGVDTKPQRLDPQTLEWLHGWQLRCWYDAREAFAIQFKQKTGKDFQV